jgi:phosphocarrier protein
MLRTYLVKDEIGLHARPASLLVQEASKFQNEVHIIYEDKKLTLKSIMAVMSLGIPYNANFSIEVEGDNAIEVFKAMEDIMIEHHVI